MSILGSPVVVAGVGARTAIGATAPATAAAARAGISGFANHAFMVDTAGKKMIVASAPYISIDITGSARLMELALPAVREALAPLGSQRPTLPVFIGLPPDRPGRAKDTATTVLFQLREYLLDYRISQLVPIETGHAAGAMALQSAWEVVRSGRVEYALAGGVDSYLEPETLEWLEENDQLHSSGLHNNAYGFVPGEAAGFVLLGSSKAIERDKLRAHLELVSAATTRETKLIKTDTVCTGEGMTELFRALACGPPPWLADYLYCDMNGEPYRAEEFGFATVRAGKLFRDPSAFTAPADCWGDVGAASGPLFLQLIDAATRKGYAQGKVIAAFTSSESGERCGFIAQAWHAKGKG